MIDKKFCMSSYLAFRYIEKDDKEFTVGLHHTGDIPYPEEKKTIVYTAEDIANAFVFLVSDEASYITGVILSADGMARS